MVKVARSAALICCAISTAALSAKREFIPPPMPAGYDDPGPEASDPMGQIARELRTTLKDPYSVQQFAMCGSRINPASPPYSPTSSWERAERLVYFLLNAKNSYGAYTGVQEGIASFRDGRLTHLSLITIGDQYAEDQEKMAQGRGDCHSIPDEDIQRRIRAAT